MEKSDILISFSCTNKTKQMSVFSTHTVLKFFFLNVNIYFFLSKRQEIQDRLDREPKKKKKKKKKMTFCFNLLFAIQSENRHTRNCLMYVFLFTQKKKRINLHVKEFVFFIKTEFVLQRYRQQKKTMFYIWHTKRRKRKKIDNKDDNTKLETLHAKKNQGQGIECFFLFI